MGTNDYTSQDVADHLCHLTHASRLEQRGDIPALRQLGRQAYHRHYAWLEEHGIDFVYDREARCYVEIDNETPSQNVV